MFHRLIILVLTDFGTTPGHNTVEYLIRCHKSNWQAVNWFVKEKWNERLWFFLQWYILVVYSSINASNWLSLTFWKVQLQKFCNFYTSLDGLMSKTICISKLCAIENKNKWRLFRNIKNCVELQENPELLLFFCKFHYNKHFARFYTSFHLNIFWIFWRVIQKLEYQVSKFLYKKIQEKRNH